MDVAYDHIQEETLTTDRSSTPTPKDPSSSADATTPTARAPKQDLNTEFQETFRAFSASPWGAKLGGFFGQVRKQSESYYAEARQEYNAASEEALKGFTDLRTSLVNRTRGLSLNEKSEDQAAGEGSASDATAAAAVAAEDKGKRKERTESEIIRENDSLIARFRSEASKRLKDIEKAEDAADEALLRFGTNIRNFLRDAVSVAPPTAEASGESKILFESKDSEGKRVIHTTRFDAQLHVIHSSFDSFANDPVSSEWPKWKDSFKIDEKTDAISEDLNKHQELRTAMEKLVPEKVEYADFWRRYYFLRMVIETEEKKRKELLRGAHPEEEEVAWEEDSESDAAPATPQSKPVRAIPASSDSTATAKPDNSQQSSSNDTLKPATEGRRSNDQHSQPDSDASYDLVSGATSRTPGSPKDDKPKEKTVAEESDEEDWE